jgi:hypothetical protein
MIIIGAGMAGLLSAHYFRDYQPTVFEQAAGPKDNHGALLRFRSSSVMDITGAPLKEVFVRKAVFNKDLSLSDRCSLVAANCYSQKVTHQYSDRSIHDLSPVRRWVAADDFMERMRKGINIEYDSTVNIGDLPWGTDPDGHIAISTIPMSETVKHLPISPLPEFKSLPITSIEAKFTDVDLHQTVYQPWYHDHLKEDLWILSRVYRASFVGDRLILELASDAPVTLNMADLLINTISHAILGLTRNFTLTSVKVQKTGKIVPLPVEQRRALVEAVTERFGIYSVGRFATWRQLLLDDVVGDLRTVRNLMESDHYSRKVHYANLIR